MFQHVIRNQNLNNQAESGRFLEDNMSPCPIFFSKFCLSEFCVLANRWLSTEVPDHSFFMFLQLKANEKCGLNLATLESMVHGHKEEFKAHLLRMQSKALTELFFEKLKGNASIEMANQKLPPWLKSVDFDSEFQWLLFRTIVYS